MEKRKRVSWFYKVSSRLGLLLQAFQRFDSDSCFLLSAGIAFALLICAIPLILLLLALLGAYLFSYREVFSQIQEFLRNYFPNLDPKIMANISRIVRNRQIFGIIGLGGLIWTSTWVFSSLRTALNIIFRAEKGHGMFHGKAIDLLLVLLAGVLLLASMGLFSAVAILQHYSSHFVLNLGTFYQVILRYVIPLLLAFIMFFLIYQIAPNRKVQVGAALKGTIFTSILWEAAKQLFGWYVLHVSRFSLVYGSLGTLAVIFIWIYYSAAIFLLGAEITVLLEEENKKSRDRNSQHRNIGIPNPR